MKREIVRPTVDEIRSFLAHTSSCDQSTYLHPSFRLAAATGMRCGELVGLAWSDITLEAGTLEVHRSLGVDGGEVFAKTPKSEAGVRLVAVDAETVHVLRVQRARLAEDRLRDGASYVQKPLGLHLVFRGGPDGALIRPD